MSKHEQRQARLKEYASLHDKLARSLELQASLSKEIWKGGTIKTTLFKLYGPTFFECWSVELTNEDVILPKITLAKLKNDNNRLFHWVMETSVMQKALASSNLNTKEMKELRNENKSNNN
tara:strand:+ start:1209 stop:1568 length:360 start_codon:yes stop_codon:yes gene_type:complete